MRPTFRRVCLVASWLLVAAVVAQLLLAGLGIFVSAAFFEWHGSVGGGAVALSSLIVLAAGGLTHVRGAVRTGAAIFGLVIVQSLLLFPYHLEATAWLRAISALHVVNAVLILVLALRLAHRLTEQRREYAG